MKDKKAVPVNWWNTYQKYTRGIILHDEGDLKDISYWRNEIFFRMLSFLTPLSVIALIPGVYMSFTKNVPVLGFADLLAFSALIIILLSRGLSLRIRKLIFIATLYLLSFVLIYYLGKSGPGLLYLLALTLLSSLIYSPSAGYYSAWANTFICIVFSILNYAGINVPVALDYSLGPWIAITSNLVLLSFTCAAVINLLLTGLTISFSDNKFSEEKLKKANRLYRFISRINQNIIHVKDEEPLFKNSCQVAYNLGKFKMTWIGKFDLSSRKIILVSQNGIPEKDLHLFNALYENNGPQDYILRTGSYYVCNDVQNDLELKNWKPYANLHGVQSCMILPIKKGGFITGSFNLYATELNFFDEEEIRLLVEATKNISFALDVFEKERKQVEAELLLQNSFDKLELILKEQSAILNTLPASIALLNKEGKIVKVNDEWIKFGCENGLGDSYSKLGANYLEISEKSTGIDRDAGKQMAFGLKQILTGEIQSFSMEYAYHLPTEKRWFSVEAKPFKENYTTGAVVMHVNITERKLSEEKVKQSEAHLAQAQRLARMGSWSFDFNADVLTWSDELYNVFGANKQTFAKTHDSFIHLIDENDRGFVLRTSREAQKTGNPFSIEYNITTPSGEKRIIEEHGFGEKDVHGKVIRLFGTAQDITEQVVARKKLQESEERYRLIVETAQEGIWLIDKNNKTIFVNKRYCELFGYSFEEMIGKTNFELMDEEVKAFGREKIENRKKGVSEDFETAYIAKNGKRIWVNVSASPITDASGNYMGALAMVTDISVRRKAEEYLKQSEAKLNEAQSIAHLGSWQWELRSNTFHLSDEGCRIFGLNHGQNNITFKAWLSRLHEEDRNEILQVIKKSRNTLSDISFHYRIRLNNTIRYIYSESRFVLNASKQLTALHGIMQDITERKLAEAERENMISNIIQHSKNLEQFAAIVSHNLRAPVATILGLSNVLKNNPSKDDKTRTEQFLFRATEQLDNVLQDLNKILQVKSGINEYKERVSFQELVEAVISSIHTVIKTEMVEIITDFSELETITSIKSYIHSVFYNLISNSIKYRKPGEKPVITITSAVDKEKATLTFKDNGMGLDLSVHGNKIFGLYKRFHLNIEGKGVGLFMVKTQIENLGGTISLKSKPGEGTEFTIELPL